MGDGAGRSVLLAVEPHLLQDLLGRLLSASGWTVQTDQRADVVVRSRATPVDVGEGVDLTVVLPGDDGMGGEVRRAGRPAQDLPVGPGVLEAVLGVLAGAI